MNHPDIEMLLLTVHYLGLITHQHTNTILHTHDAENEEIDQPSTYDVLLKNDELTPFSYLQTCILPFVDNHVYTSLSVSLSLSLSLYFF